MKYVLILTLFGGYYEASSIDHAEFATLELCQQAARTWLKEANAINRARPTAVCAKTSD